MLDKLHVLNINQGVGGRFFSMKIQEEAEEVADEINKLCCEDSLDDLASELLDVLQVIKGIAYLYDINLDDHVEKHNQKMIDRGYGFID